MIEGSRRIRGASLKCLFVLAGVAGSAPATASAQLINDFVAQDRVVWSPVATTEGKLSVQASPQVLYSGQSSNVNVFAHLAGSPAPYAFASSTFDIYASDSAWSFASDGAIVGNDVLGASASQAHMPRLGQLADSSNPFRVWHGVFTPQSKAPALIEIKADPTDFSVYPNMFTSSSAQCDAEGDSDFLFVNPVRVGQWLAAPGKYSAIRSADDVIVDGRIITGWDRSAASLQIISLANPAIDPVSVGTTWTGSVLLDSSTTIGFDQPPTSFSATVQVMEPPSIAAGNQGSLAVGVDDVSLNRQQNRKGTLDLKFDRVAGGGYAIGASETHLNGGGRFYAFEGFSGGVRVATGDLNGDGQNPGLVISDMPQRIAVKLGSRRLILQGDGTYVGLAEGIEGQSEFTESPSPLLKSNPPTGRVYVGTDQGVYDRDGDLEAVGSDAATAVQNSGALVNLSGTNTWTLEFDQPVAAVVHRANGPEPIITLDYIVLVAIPNSANNATRPDGQLQIGLGAHVFEAEGVQEIVITPSQRN